MLIKIADPPPPPCRHPEHNPPNMIVLPDGTYEHTCPGCGHRTSFVVANTIWCSVSHESSGVTLGPLPRVTVSV